MTQQPRTPTTEAGRHLRSETRRWGLSMGAMQAAEETILAIEAEARADLLAQIEKAVLGLPGAMTPEDPRDAEWIAREYGDILDRASVLAAIHSAAPVEPT